MDARITPKPLAGTLAAIASKSIAHRALICAALADAPTRVICNTTSQDIEATARCLKSLGAAIERTEGGFDVTPVSAPVAGALLDCGESGSTERFLLPVAAALACDASLTGQGRLAARPLSPLYEELCAHGAELSAQGAFPLHVGGALRGGAFEIAGNVSSQFISGLLLAAPLLSDGVSARVTAPVESRSYIDLTIDALAAFGAQVRVGEVPDATVFAVDAGSKLTSPGTHAVEGDWSNAAFWLAAGALSDTGVAVSGLNAQSSQGDRVIARQLASLGAELSWDGDTLTARTGALRGAVIDVADCPDLVPPIAAVASCAHGTTRIVNAGRLRLKESDRLVTVSEGLAALGAHIEIDGDSLIIEGRGRLDGGCVDAAGDHRIAMMAAVAAIRCDAPVAITGAQCVAKSYPDFFADYARLGGLVHTEG